MEKRIELERRGKEPAQIKELILDNSRATHIEGLTEDYASLESLSMINVGLTSLKGFPKLPALTRLELSDNRISNGLNVLQGAPKLSHLNLSGNKIKELETLEPLQTLSGLTHLDLFHNPIDSNDEETRSKIFKLLPSLKFLDGTDIDNKEDESDLEDGPNGALEEEEDDDDEDGEEGEDEAAGGAEEEEGAESEEDDDEEDGEEEEEDDGPGLAAIYDDNLPDDEDGDFEEGEEEEEEDVEEEEDEEDSEEPRGKKPKLDEAGEA